MNNSNHISITDINDVYTLIGPTMDDTITISGEDTITIDIADADYGISTIDTGIADYTLDTSSTGTVTINNSYYSPNNFTFGGIGIEPAASVTIGKTTITEETLSKFAAIVELFDSLDSESDFKQLYDTIRAFKKLGAE